MIDGATSVLKVSQSSGTGRGVATTSNSTGHCFSTGATGQIAMYLLSLIVSLQISHQTQRFETYFQGLVEVLNQPHKCRVGLRCF